jgi:hypothetical protein
MKKLIMGALALTGIILLLVVGCDKDAEILIQDQDTANTLVYEDPSLINEVSPNFYDNHIYRIEYLGENQEKRRVEQAARESGVDMDCLLLGEVKKFYFNHTGVTMYSIPTNDPEQTVVLYESQGLFQVAVAEFRPLAGNRSYYGLKTLDDQAFFSFQLDQEMRIGEISIADNDRMDSFNEEVYYSTLETNHQKSAHAEDAECCRKETTWRACVKCSANACHDSWACSLTSIFAGPELAAAFAISCIGAGPDARC